MTEVDQPAEAIKLLYRIISTPGVAIVPSYVANDLANVRRGIPDDADFANAISAISAEILRAAVAPKSHGIALKHDLDGWRRSKFSSRNETPADLRLVFRAAKPDGIEVLAFGARDFPDSVYFTAKTRSNIQNKFQA